MIISCKIGEKGSYKDSSLPSVGKPDDVLELVDYPDKGLSQKYVCVRCSTKSKTGEDVCDLCEIDYVKQGLVRICLNMECRCHCGQYNTYLVSMDNVMEAL